MAGSARPRGWDGVRPGREVLSLTEVAKRYAVSYGTAYQWARSGKIPAFQFGERGRWRVFLSDLLDTEEGVETVRSPLKGDAR